MRKSKTLSALLRPDRALHRQNVHFFRRIGVYLQGSQVVARLLSARIERNDQHGRVARHDGPLGEFRLHAFARLGHFQHDQRLVARIDESDRLCDRRAFRIGRSQIDRFLKNFRDGCPPSVPAASASEIRSRKRLIEIGIENSANEPTDDRTGRPPPAALRADSAKTVPSQSGPLRRQGFIASGNYR